MRRPANQWRRGHANPRAAPGYQHATADRDRALAQALADLDRLALGLGFPPQREGLWLVH